MPLLRRAERQLQGKAQKARRRGADGAASPATTPTPSRSCSSATPTPPSRSPTASAAGARWPRTSPRRPSSSVWRSGARYDRARGSVRTWTLGIVHNRAVDALRRSGVHDRRRASDEGIEETLEAPERTDAQALDKAVSQEIRGALGELPAEQRRVIELAYFGGFTHLEIASMLGTPVGTVKGRMRLGLHKLRGHLQGLGGGGHMSPRESDFDCPRLRRRRRLRARRARGRRAGRASASTWRAARSAARKSPSCSRSSTSCPTSVPPARALRPRCASASSRPCARRPSCCTPPAPRPTGRRLPSAAGARAATSRWASAPPPRPASRRSSPC